jgi:hypothetical protein
LLLPQEAHKGFQASRRGRELLNQAGIGFGREADTDPVGAGTDVDAGRVRTEYGQRLDLGGLLLLKGFGLGLGPGFATGIGFALGLGLSLLAAGRRGGGCLACGRGCSPREAPKKRREEEIGVCPEAVCGGGGRDKSPITVANGNHTIRRRSPRIGVTRDEAENAPRLRVTYGED